MRPLITVGGLKIAFKTFDSTATEIQHGLIVTGSMMQEGTNQLTEHLLVIYFESPCLSSCLQKDTGFLLDFCH